MTSFDATGARDAIAALDNKRGAAVEAAREAFVPLGSAMLPLFVEAYPRLRKWESRNAIVHTAMKFARRHDEAVELGRMALTDRSRSVRYRALMLLAYAQKPDFIQEIEPLPSHAGGETRADARAAIDALRQRNHHYFLDRRHTGRVFLSIGGSDEESSASPDSRVVRANSLWGRLWNGGA